MTITNFTLVPHGIGNTIFPADIDSSFLAVHAVMDLLIDANSRTPLLPIGFSGSNQIPSIPVINSYLYIDGSGNLTVQSRQALDDAVTAAATSAGLAAGSAASAAESYNAALALGAVLPTQSGKAGLSIITDGNLTSWGVSNAETLAILNFVGYFQ